MNYEDFYQKIKNHAKNRPSYIREGQEIFNYLDYVYNVSRYVQFEKHIDCFYDDSQIDDFINAAYVILKDNNVI